MRNVLVYPLAFRVEPGDAPAAARVFHVTEPVPDDPASIKRIVEDPRSALPVPVNGACAPCGFGGSGNAFPVQPRRDGPGRESFGVFREYAGHDGGLFGIDGAVAADGIAVLGQALDDAIAV